MPGLPPSPPPLPLPDRSSARGASSARARRGPWVGAGLLLLALGSGPLWLWPVAAPSARAGGAQAAASGPPGTPAPIAPGASPVPGVPAHRAARFGSEVASAEARHIASWAMHSGDPGPRGVVLVDTRNAKVFVFDAQGELRGAAPALLGSAIGDHTVPGVGDKPVAQVRPEERTTPAGRFVAEPGLNASGEDVVWVDYDAAVSMHRVRPHVKAERRLERLASATPADNRISYGCINLPVSFYEKVLSPLVRSTGAVIYVLPETRSAADLFGAYEVPLVAHPETR